ncbi:hypothetical protein AeRB84_002408 [Aphanomyces euteiches]|nr:hypothetical protein AeRB84_002408 [Aphanomyces euteiches]
MLKRRIEDEERRLRTARVRQANRIQDHALRVDQVKCYKCHGFGHKTPDCPSADAFDIEGNVKSNNRRGGFKKKHVKQASQAQSDGANLILNVRSSVKDYRSAWFGDSGSTIHVCGPMHRHLLHDVIDLDVPPSSKLVIKTPHGTRTITDVHYFPQSGVSLLSLVVLHDRGCDYGTVGSNDLVVTKNDVEVLRFRKDGPLYELIGKLVPPDRVFLAGDIDLWHRRLGHVSQDALHKLAIAGFGMPDLTRQVLGECDLCSRSNLHRQPFNSAKKQPDLPDTVSVDLLFFSQNSRENHSCALNVVTHDHRLSYVAPLRSKSEALEEFKRFFAYYKTQLNTSIKHVKSDGGGEFAGRFHDFLLQNGVEHHVTPRETPQLNGVAERTGDTLGAMTRALLNDSKLPRGYWSDAVVCAAYLRNRLPSAALGYKTPIEVFTKRKPNMTFLRRFGQTCYAKNPDGRKLDDRGTKCILLGFGPLGYKLLEIDGRSGRRVIYRRHCVFVNDATAVVDDDDVSDTIPPLDDEQMDVDDEVPMTHDHVDVDVDNVSSDGTNVNSNGATACDNPLDSFVNPAHDYSEPDVTAEAPAQDTAAEDGPTTGHGGVNNGGDYDGGDGDDGLEPPLDVPYGRFDDPVE